MKFSLVFMTCCLGMVAISSGQHYFYWPFSSFGGSINHHQPLWNAVHHHQSQGDGAESRSGSHYRHRPYASSSLLDDYYDEDDSRAETLHGRGKYPASNKRRPGLFSQRLNPFVFTQRYAQTTYKTTYALTSTVTQVTTTSCIGLFIFMFI